MQITYTDKKKEMQYIFYLQDGSNIIKTSSLSDSTNTKIRGSVISDDIGFYNIRNCDIFKT